MRSHIVLQTLGRSINFKISSFGLALMLLVLQYHKLDWEPTMNINCKGTLRTLIKKMACLILIFFASLQGSEAVQIIDISKIIKTGQRS